jgi:hypothetical protein
VRVGSDASWRLQPAIIPPSTANDIHSNAGAGEIRISHLIIVDNHGKVLPDEQGDDGEVYITRYATEQTIYR